MEVCIANKLKTKRKELGLSIKEVVAKLHFYNIDVSEKTLYGWESGHRQPDADTLIALCQIYGINNFSEFCDAGFDNPIETSNDTGFIKKYHTLNQSGRQKVEEYVDMLIKTGEFNLPDCIPMLNLDRIKEQYDPIIEAFRKNQNRPVKK